MSIQQDWQDSGSPKRGMSGGTKLLLVLGGVGGFFLLVCCGGIGFFIYKARNLVTDNPEVVKTRTQDIVTIEVLPGFKPVQAMDMVFMKIVVYQGETDDDAQLMLMEFDKSWMQGNKQQQQDQMLEQMRAQQGDSADIEAEETQKREFTIAGRKSEFTFIKGKSDEGKAVRQVTGSFPTSDGVALLMLIVPEEKYDEAAVIRMLESIRVPESAVGPEAESMEESSGGEDKEAAGSTIPLDQPDQSGTTKPDEDGETEKPEAESNS